MILRRILSRNFISNDSFLHCLFGFWNSWWHTRSWSLHFFFDYFLFLFSWLDDEMSFFLKMNYIYPYIQNLNNLQTVDKNISKSGRTPELKSHSCHESWCLCYAARSCQHHNMQLYDVFRYWNGYPAQFVAGVMRNKSRQHFWSGVGSIRDPTPQTAFVVTPWHHNNMVL